MTYPPTMYSMSTANHDLEESATPESGSSVLQQCAEVQSLWAKFPPKSLLDLLNGDLDGILLARSPYTRAFPC